MGGWIFFRCAGTPNFPNKTEENRDHKHSEESDKHPTKDGDGHGNYEVGSPTSAGEERAHFEEMGKVVTAARGGIAVRNDLEVEFAYNSVGIDGRAFRFHQGATILFRRRSHPDRRSW